MGIYLSTFFKDKIFYIVLKFHNNSLINVDFILVQIWILFFEKITLNTKIFRFLINSMKKISSNTLLFIYYYFSSNNLSNDTNYLHKYFTQSFKN